MARYRMDRVPKFVLTFLCPGLFRNRHHTGVFKMIHPVDTILSLALLSILFSFGSSRLPSLIKVLAFQGIVVCIGAPLHRPRHVHRRARLYHRHNGHSRHHHSRLHPFGHKAGGHPAGRFNPSSDIMPPFWPASCSSSVRPLPATISMCLTAVRAPFYCQRRSRFWVPECFYSWRGATPSPWSSDIS